AALYDHEGADELVFLDITATEDNRGTILDAVAETVSQISIPLTVGGGVRSIDDIQALLNAGATRVSIGTAAIANPGLINESAARFGSHRIVIAIDAKKNADTDHWEVVTHGGRTTTGRDVRAWAQEVAQRGAGEIL